MGLLLVFVEDLGGQVLHGPTSLWWLKELKQYLEDVNDDLRGAGFCWCRLARTTIAVP